MKHPIKVILEIIQHSLPVLLQFISSTLLRQSFCPSHTQVFEIHRPLVH